MSIVTDTAVALRDAGTILYRTFPIQIKAGDIDEKTREVPFIIATEAPADMGWGMPEILLMSGMEVEDAERGVPMLNAHQRSDVENVLGRVLRIKVKGDKAHAVYRFSKATKKARDAFGLVKDGSIDAASIGYLIKTFAEVAEGETFVAPEGEKIKGPAIVGITWTLKESSLVPIGADKNALKRALSAAKQEQTMPGKAVKTAKKKATKRKTKKKVTKRKVRAEDEEDEEEKEEDEDAEEKAEDEDEEKFGDDEDDEEKAEDDDEEEKEEDEEDDDEEDDDDDESKSLDALDARQREDRRSQILSFTPRDLRSFAEDLILGDPGISPEAARAALLKERTKRLGSVGTPPPVPAGARSKKGKSKNNQETGSAALAHLIREVN